MSSLLFEKNLKVVEKYQADLAEKLRTIESPASHLVSSGDGSSHNIDLGHIDFYDGSAEEFSSKQFDQFVDDPQRVQLGWPVPLAENEWKAQTFRTELREYYLDKGIENAPQSLDEDAAFSIVLGLGLGFHIDKLFTNYATRSLYVVEQYVEFIYQALHVHDVSDWYEEAERRNGRFLILVGENPNNLVNVLFTHVKYNDFGLVDGVYFYEHYDSFFLKQFAELFKERLPLFAANPGFFEDEIVMLGNSFHNITSLEFLDFTDANRFAKDTPVFIAGSGPSIDKSIDLIVENREGIVLITAGTGLGAILEYGLKPDFHVDTENTPGPPELIGKLSQKFDLSGITLIAPNTVHPEVPKYFDRSILYFRDAVTATKLFGANSQEIFHAAPTVANAATRIGLGLGFKEFYLAGVDLGAREQDNHHSRKSVYHSEGFFDTHPAHKIASTFGLRARGNLGGEVYTNTSFLNASVFFSAFGDTFPLATLYNLSDGVRIEGTIPKLPETVSITPKETVKERELRQINDMYERGAARMNIDKRLMEDLCSAMDSFYQEIKSVVQQADSEKCDIMDFYDAIKPIIYMDRTTNIQKTVHQFNVGTIMMYFQTGYQMIRRLKEEQRPEFFALFKGKFLKYIDDMEMECMTFLNDMNAKI